MLDQFILDHSIFYMERSKETSDFRQGIKAMRPLCGKKHGGNRKERLRPYASFPDRQPYRPPLPPRKTKIKDIKNTPCGA